MERWNELCFLLSESLPSNVSEQLFEIKVVQAFEKIGWSEYKGDISVRDNIQLGASNRISPDLTFKNNEKKSIFIVEVKKPSLNLNSPTFESQLSSYLGITRLDIGLLIGNKIQIFIDGKFFNSDGIILIDEIELKPNNGKGIKFIELFSKETYSQTKIVEYAEKKIIELKELKYKKALNEKLLAGYYDSRIKELLQNELIEQYSEKVVSETFESIRIEIKDINELKENSFITKTINSATFRSNEIQTNSDTNKLPIGKYVRKTFGELIDKGLVNNDEVLRLQKTDYSKNIFDIQFPFLVREDSSNYERIRYWKNPYIINNKVYYVCSQWYEVPANNDRPYYESWLKKMK